MTESPERKLGVSTSSEHRIMDSANVAKNAGSYFGVLVDRNTERAAYALRFGKGKPLINPFTREKMPTRVSKPLLHLAQQLAKRRLNLDSEFMAAAVSAIADIARGSLDDFFGDVESRQRHGDGGTGISLLGEDGSALDMQRVQGAMNPTVVDEARLRMCVDWPRNASSQGACPCCGYYTLLDPPASREMCPVCFWGDRCDLSDPWNMTNWGYMPGDKEYWEGALQEDFEPTPDISEARICFAQFGAHAELYVEHVRKALPEEEPRYDWNADPRPYRSKEPA